MSADESGEDPQSAEEAARMSALWRSLWHKHRVKIGLAAVTLVLVPVAVNVFSQMVGETIEAVEFDEPVRARVLSLSRNRESGNDWLFADARVLTPAELASFGTAAARNDHDTLRGLGAVDPLTLVLALLVQGQRHDGVTITDLRLDAACGAPLAGALVHQPKPGGGPQANPRMVFDLDRPGRKGLVVNEDQSLGGEYFRANSIPLAENEQVVIITEVRTQRQHCSFSIEVGASDGKATGWVPVDTGGRRLAVSGLAGGVTDAEQLTDFTGYGVLYRYADGTVVRATPDELRGAP